MRSMCGRFTLTVSARVLAELFDVPEAPDLGPRYNIAPTQTVVIARQAADGPREMALVRWGLIPFWAKDQAIGARMINARGETVASKPAFRSAVKQRRCLIPADGFYEWRKIAVGKQPFFIRFADRRAFAFAGLWDRWRRTEDTQEIVSCTIITTSPNELVGELHDRMPVILPPDRFDEWLRPGPLLGPALESLLQPYPADEMEAFPVSRRVNSPANDDADCVRPLSE
jgi:putative SOS response-associated peptidase YedK